MSETPRVETYGLASDEARARVQVWREGDLVESEIIFGKSTGPDSAEVYAKRREIESVYAVDARILDLLSVDVDALRSRDIFRLSPSAVKQFSVFRGEHKLIVSRAEAGEWQISEPGKWPADRQVVEDTILALSKWRAAAFIEATDASNMVAQLEPPHCVIHLSASAAGPDDRSGGDSTDESEAPVPGKVSIGRWKDGDTHVPLRLDGDTTLRLVPLELIRSVATSPTDALVYRKRRMLSIPPAGVKRIALESGSLSQAVIQDETGTWVAENATNAVSEETIRDILFFAADMRADRIEALATNDLSAYGLDDARATLTLGLSGQAGIQKTVMLGAPAGEKGVYSMVQGQDLVFVLPVLLGDRLFSGLLNEE